uniref:Uncharacterized protein n=1 Tax=Arion vulgaris TaxID=1028688 RepID=A0A0B7AYT4_9EUPU
MASTKQNDSQKSGPSDALKSHGLSLSHSKLDSYSGISDENDRNSNLSPSKSTDPTRKKTFKITSVKKGGSGDIGGDNDADSIDGLDESQTEDLSSEFYDSSKATDLDMDLQDCMNIPLTPDEMTSTTTIVVKQKPDQNSQSRFRVVKIETKEPFRRGKWVCYDFFDTAPTSVVTVEKNGSKMMEDSIIQSALSGNLSSSSSVHYVQDVNDSSSNIFIPPVVPMSPPRTDGQHILSDVFTPIQPAPASHVLSQLDGLSSDVLTPFIAQQVLMSVASVPSSSTSFHNLAQSGHATIIQSLPHSSLFPFSQNAPPVSLFQNGTAGQTSQLINLPTDAILAISGSIAPTVLAPSLPTADDSYIQGPVPVIIGGVPVPHSQSQTQIAGETFVAQGVHQGTEAGQSSAASSGVPASMTHVPQSRTEAALATSGMDTTEQMGPGMDESTGSVKTLQGDSDGQTSEGLKEAVEAVGEMYMGLEDDVDESGGSTVAIDNKIEQAMDLVKRHLMYAVREEVEILKQQIGEMMDRIGQLEYENTLLRSEAKPETLSKLLQPRLTQPAQTTLSTQPQTVSITSAPATQQTIAAQTQPQQQQQQQQTSMSQVGQPPSTT